MARFSPFWQSIHESRKGLLARWGRLFPPKGAVWFHVSSVGELEQIRPVMDLLKADSIPFVLSYFSPSVPQLIRNWDFVAAAEYLPFDRLEDMRAMFRLLEPKLLVLNRYDLWPHHLQAAREFEVPVLLVNASTPPLGWWGRLGLWFRRPLFREIKAWGFVDGAAAHNWEPYLIERAAGRVTGNPRVDRAIQRTKKELSNPLKVPFQWRAEGPCLVAGSTWKEDEALLLAAKAGWSRLLLVPHEPSEERLREIAELLKRQGMEFVFWSQANGEVRAPVVVVDIRGILAELYGLGRWAYVGGGFGRQVHSVIEPLAHGLPVAFGPHCLRSPEAMQIDATGAGLRVQEGAGQLVEWLNEMNGAKRPKAEENVDLFIKMHQGAAERVTQMIVQMLKMGASRGPF
jgi:3-deoxy-D-manno-octulosonic-acid transferase